jgi:hypothetical protein
LPLILLEGTVMFAALSGDGEYPLHSHAIDAAALRLREVPR